MGKLLILPASATSEQMVIKTKGQKNALFFSFSAPHAKGWSVARACAPFKVTANQRRKIYCWQLKCLPVRLQVPC